MGWKPNVAPTGDPKDCICGGAEGNDGFRFFDIVCPCCDGRWIIKLPSKPVGSLLGYPVYTSDSIKPGDIKFGPKKKV
jgi:hypothetical protein